MSGVAIEPLDTPLRRLEDLVAVYAEEDEPATLDTLVEIVRAASGVMTQMDYETPHHARLKDALARLDSP